LAGLRGARFVTATETEDGVRWAEAKIKSMTGGDKIAARFMRCDFFEFRPEFKLVIAGNHKPGLRSVDEAIRRRLHLILIPDPSGMRRRRFCDTLNAIAELLPCGHTRRKTMLYRRENYFHYDFHGRREALSWSHPTNFGVEGQKS